MKNIIIVDDHKIFRDGLKMIINYQKNLNVKSDISEVKKLYKLLKKHDYDLLILDLNLPDVHGLDALRQVKSISPDLPVLILSELSEEQYGIRLIKEGADGYLNKKCAADELIKAIKIIFKGEIYLSPSLSKNVLLKLNNKSKLKPHENLSKREFQVLSYIAKGLSTNEIGEKCCLSPQTISTYKKRIKKKLNLKSTAELVKYCISEKLIELS